MTEPYPGYIACAQRWKAIREKDGGLCRPGWLDHIKLQPDVYDEVRALREEVKALRAALDETLRKGETRVMA